MSVLNWQRIRAELECEPWEPADEPYREERRLFVGTVFALGIPCGEGEEEWWEGEEKAAEAAGCWIATAEGDPCDVLVGQSRDVEE